jgi:outer membrane protein with beta-barrel domain
MRRTLVLCWLCVLLAPRAASAEWHFTPLFGVTFGGNTTFVDLQHGTGKTHVNFGGAVSRFGNGVLGVEGIVIYTRHFFEFDGPRDPADPVAPAIAKSYTLSAMGNVVLTVPKRWTEYFLRPYVSGGFGMVRAVSIEETPLFPLTSTMPGFNIGGGAIGFLTQGTGLRFDFRYHAGLRHDPGKDAENVVGPDLHLRYMTAQIGVVIRR